MGNGIRESLREAIELSRSNHESNRDTTEKPVDSDGTSRKGMAECGIRPNRRNRPPTQGQKVAKVSAKSNETRPTFFRNGQRSRD
jgi:hypothetical protein